MMRFAMPALSVVVALLALGCDSSGPAKLVATYSLQSVDGVPLPTVVRTTPLRLEFTAERIMLYDDRSFVEREEYVEGTGTDSRATTINTRGKWEKRPSGFNLEFKGSEFLINTRECVRSGEIVTCTLFFGPVWVYRQE